MARTIVSACGLIESRSKAQISMMPPGGMPALRSDITEYNAPMHAPRLPSQYSGFGSNLYIGVEDEIH